MVGTKNQEPRCRNVNKGHKCTHRLLTCFPLVAFFTPSPRDGTVQSRLGPLTAILLKKIPQQTCLQADLMETI